MAKRMKEKALARKQNADKRPQATAKFVRISPTKVNIVLNIIRGKSYTDAMAILQGTPKAASEILIKVLASAGANAENNLNMSKEDLFIAEAYANQGPTYKRWWPRSHGSADTILKRTSHITIILDEKKSDIIATPVKKEEKTVTKSAEAKATTTTATKKTEVKKPTTEKAEVKKTTPAKKPATEKKTATTTKKVATKTAKGGAK